MLPKRKVSLLYEFHADCIGRDMKNQFVRSMLIRWPHITQAHSGELLMPTNNAIYEDSSDCLPSYT